MRQHMLAITTKLLLNTHCFECGESIDENDLLYPLDMEVEMGTSDGDPEVKVFCSRVCYQEYVKKGHDDNFDGYELEFDGQKFIGAYCYRDSEGNWYQKFEKPCRLFLNFKPNTFSMNLNQLEGDPETKKCWIKGWKDE